MARLGQEAGHIARQWRRHHRRGGQQAHLAAHAGREGCHVAFDALGAQQQFARVFAQALAGGRGLDAVAAPGQQRRADLRFQLGQALADRAGRQVGFGGGADDVAVVADGHEQPQIGEIQVAHGSRISILENQRRKNTSLHCFGKA